ncbi:uncharacterized protein LOC123395278 [Hordeum vulgare subsp. vulgare]|uniref:Uncharacterized protein n=1 Tax=Hordeum vulgare subsp. vulgare TaxID=112509 RepID=A0A8I7B0D1_HORVV|nr:uncharacterized protein LOC123395278 [Hordeum vulgare subsp. vulgare]
MSDTVVITVVDNSFINKSRLNQWSGIQKELQTDTSSADGIERVMFTCRFMEDRPFMYRACHDRDPTAMSIDVQRSEVVTVDAGYDAVNVLQTDKGQITDNFARTAAEEVMVCARRDRCHAAYACPEAQLMASNPVIYLNDEGLVRRLLRWVADICGGGNHAVYACPEAQLMAGCPFIQLNEEGPIEWLLR